MTRLVAAATAAVLLLTGCGSIRERLERADRIIDGVDKAAAARSALMTISVGVDLRLEGAAATPGAAGGQGAEGANPEATITAQADLAKDRVAYLGLDPAGAPRAVRIYSGTTIYSRLLGEAQTKRPWVRLDLTSLDPDEIDNDDVEITDAVRRLEQAQGFDNPLFLLKLLRGTLSGSVDELGREDIRGVPTTHYKLNVDREKAVEDEDEDVQDAYEAMFRTMFATRTVLPGEVWLDDEGLPRRYTLTLKPNLRRRALADLRFTVEMFDIGQPVVIELPGKAETVEVDGLGGLAQAVAGGGA